MHPVRVLILSSEPTSKISPCDFCSGPSAEEPFLREEGMYFAFTEKSPWKDKWETWLQENWEDCMVRA